MLIGLCQRYTKAMKKKVVIVDDAPFIQEILMTLLSQMDCDVVGVASDGQQAVETVLAQKPDLVFLDLILPEKNGIQVAKEILEYFPEIPIVVMSTVDQKTMIDESLKVGCVEFIAKPFDKKDIESSIKKHLGKIK